MIADEGVEQRIMLEAVRRLWVAVLLRAAWDARGTDPVLASESRGWLRDVGGALAARLGFSPERIDQWLRQLPALPCAQPALLSSELWEGYDGDTDN